MDILFPAQFEAAYNAKHMPFRWAPGAAPVGQAHRETHGIRAEWQREFHGVGLHGAAQRRRREPIRGGYGDAKTAAGQILVHKLVQKRKGNWEALNGEPDAAPFDAPLEPAVAGGVHISDAIQRLVDSITAGNWKGASAGASQVAHVVSANPTASPDPTIVALQQALQLAQDAQTRSAADAARQAHVVEVLRRDISRLRSEISVTRQRRRAREHPEEGNVTGPFDGDFEENTDGWPDTDIPDLPDLEKKTIKRPRAPRKAQEFPRANVGPREKSVRPKKLPPKLRLEV